MLKIIKWHVLICTIMLFFSGVTAQAISKDTVKQLDQQAEKWDYKGFNWRDLYNYFCQHISFTDFIDATKHGGHLSIDALASALLKNNAMGTIEDAKFFVYSALSALYDSHSGIGMQTAKLLQQVDSAIKPYGAEPLIYNSIRAVRGKAESILLIYENSFTLNTAITKLKLNDDLEFYLKQINEHADVRIRVDVAKLDPKKRQVIPTIHEVMQYYPDNKACVFIFLIRGEANKATDKIIENEGLTESEQQRMTAFSKAFVALWESDLTVDEREDVAEMAVNGFGFNPLHGMTFGMPALFWSVDVADAGAKVDVTNAGAKINPAEKTFEVFTSFYERLVDCLPIDGLLAALFANGVIDLKLKRELNALSLQCQKNSQLLDMIAGNLQAGDTELFEKLLAVMEANEDVLAKGLAKQIRTALKQ